MAGEPRIRFGVAGCGVIGEAHIRAIEALPFASLTALADVPGSARAANLGKTRKVRVYDDLEDMLASEDLDVVNVCTPSGLHASQAVKVMRSGRHVMVEKPMALSLEQADDMLKAESESGVKLAVISQHRFDGAALRIHALIGGEAFGQVSLATAHVPWWRTQTYYDSDAWRGTAQLDGGVLLNQAIHSIDLLRWFMGPVRSVLAYGDTLTHEMETEDVGVAVIRFAGGTLGAIAATTGAFPGLATRIEILGDRGSAVIEDDRLSVLELAEREPATRPSRSDPVWADSHVAQIADMVAALREERTPFVDGWAGRATLEVILAIVESARTGREVTLS